MRVLHIGSTLEVAGGIESFIMNLYVNIKEETIIFDFMVKNGHGEGYYANYIRKRGGQIFESDWGNNIFSRMIDKWRIYKRYKKDIIHIHTNCGIRILDGIIAKLAGCRCIIFHTHTCKGIVPVKYRILQPIYRIIGDYFFSCSLNAARYFFGEKIFCNEKYHLIHNAIDVNKYKFNNEMRKFYRDKFNIRDEYILGFVGRMSKEKNIPFVLDVFLELQKYQKARLILVGDGEEKDNILQLIKDKKIEQNTILMGEINNVNEVLTMFDGLILPSDYEGLGIVLIEAQASGLPCYVSNHIPHEVKATLLIHFLKLEDGAEAWAKYIFQSGINENRGDGYTCELKKAGYNAVSETKVVFDLYNKMIG